MKPTRSSWPCGSKRRILRRYGDRIGIETRPTPCKRWDCEKCRKYKLLELRLKIKLTWNEGEYFYHCYFSAASRIYPSQFKINGAIKVSVPGDNTVFVISRTPFTGAKRIRRKRALQLIEKYVVMEHEKAKARRIEFIGVFNKVLKERLNKDCELSNPYERYIFGSLQREYGIGKADEYIFANTFKKRENTAFWDKEDEIFTTQSEPEQTAHVKSLAEKGLISLTKAGRRLVEEPLIEEPPISDIIFEDIQLIQHVGNGQIQVYSKTKDSYRIGTVAGYTKGEEEDICWLEP